MEKKSGLGKGLAALIPQQSTKPLTSQAADLILGNNGSGIYIKEIPVDIITPNPKQPRTVFDPDALAELVFSIKEFGLLQPIVVREVSRETQYELVMGERRLRAAKLAGLTTIPAIVRSTSDNNMLRDALLENIHRVQLNPLEEAAAYQQLLEEFKVSHEELAERIGRSRPAITNTIRLLKLPISVQKKVASGVLTAGHARALLTVSEDPELVESLSKQIIAEGLSVRSVEELVYNNPQKPRTKQTHEKTDYSENENQLAEKLDTHVSISGKKQGKISIKFANSTDLERIINLIIGN